MTDTQGSSAHILVVEDDATNRTVLARQLSVVGIGAHMAANGDEGLRLWRGGGFSLVLSDLHMPVMDGFGLVRAIRAEEDAGARTPVLAFSADVRIGQAERAREAGFDAFLTKPLQLEGLRAVLGRWMAEAPGARTRVLSPRPAAAPAPLPVFDVQALADIVGDELSVMLEIVAYFDTVATGIRAELLLAAANADPVEAAMLAHRLKSSSRSVGALPLGAMCEALEEHGEAGRRHLVAPLVGEVVDALDAALAAMRQWLGAHAPAAPQLMTRYGF